MPVEDSWRAVLVQTEPELQQECWAAAMERWWRFQNVRASDPPSPAIISAMSQRQSFRRSSYMQYACVLDGILPFSRPCRQS